MSNLIKTNIIKNQVLKPNSTIGIFGGGQLARMMCFYAHQLGYKTLIFSDVNDSSASFACNQTIVANYLDENALKEFASKIDIATFEFENIPTWSVDFVSRNKAVFPNSNVLKITQNRLKEKDFLNKIGIKTTNYKAVDKLSTLQKTLKQFGYKAILKTATMGYDGKGQVVLSKESDLEKIWQNFSNLNLPQTQPNLELILEKYASFNQEISVIIARSINGEIECYKPLTNIHQNGILHKSIYPAQISQKTARKAMEIAREIILKLDLVGLLAVEFFMLDNGDLLVNELAPRPHNSGHFSINASYTSQFEQLIRAIAGLPLGNPDFHCLGYMQNLIGTDILKVDEYLANNNKAKLHLYGKDKIIDGRKMGHINFLS